ncbi:MAG: FtsQ-type POTRA domain-containing protein [Pseudomonadota bacterium]
MTLNVRETAAARRIRGKRLRRNIALATTCYLFTLGGMSGACCWGYQWLLETPGLRLEAVSVRGLQRLGREEVLVTAGVSEGAPMLALDLGRLRHRLSRLPWVGSAVVRRQWPRGLAIEIQEKAPVALIRLDSLYYLDKNARLIKKLSPFEGMDFPIITGVVPSDFDNSRKLLTDKVIPLLGGVARAGAGEVSELNIDRGMGRGDRLTLYTTEGLYVKLGERDWRSGLNDVVRVVADLRQRGLLAEVSAVDATCPSRVFVKLKNSGRGGVAGGVGGA